MKLAPMFLALLALAACQRQATEAPAASPPDPPPAPTVSDFGQPMTARGNEPFWAVRIEGVTLTLLRPGEPELAFQAPGMTASPGQAIWGARAADGQTLKLTLRISECSDGMSDLRYPMAAEVEVAGQLMTGCAAKTAELPREGG